MDNIYDQTTKGLNVYNIIIILNYNYTNTDEDYVIGLKASEQINNKNDLKAKNGYLQFCDDIKIC